MVFSHIKGRVKKQVTELKSYSWEITENVVAMSKIGEKRDMETGENVGLGRVSRNYGASQ